jgi:nucleotide-binding universal stress UspA family protein
MARMRRILFASDLSKASAKAFATAVTLAKATHVEMVILHVLVPFVPLVPESYIGGATLDQINADARRWGVQQLAKLTAKAKGGGVRASGLIMTGDPAGQIVRAARAKRAGLLVLGTHGRTGLSRLFVGSVAQRVIASARCPVVTVREK